MATPLRLLDLDNILSRRPRKCLGGPDLRTHFGRKLSDKVTMVVGILRYALAGYARRDVNHETRSPRLVQLGPLHILEL